MGAPTFEQNFAMYMENVTPVTVAEVLGHIDAQRAAWDEALRQVPVELMGELLTGPWTVRDAVAIVTWKEQRAVEIVDSRAVVETSFGQLPEPEQSRILEEGRALPLMALLAQHEVTHEALLDKVRTLSDEELNTEQMEGLPRDERSDALVGEQLADHGVRYACIDDVHLEVAHSTSPLSGNEPLR